MLKSLVVFTALVFAALSSVPVLACEGEDHAAQATPIGNITVAELARELAPTTRSPARAIAVFDANTDATREEKGVIPSATLLPSSSAYDTALLPKSKSAELVFYCAASKCSASHQAARRALEAGYTNVKVLPDGITGWLKAGQATQKVTAASSPGAPPPPARG